MRASASWISLGHSQPILEVMAIDESAIRKALGGVEELVGDRLPLARMDVPAHDRRATFGE
jgi:hypothetical protein